MANELMLQTKVLTKEEMPQSAQLIVDSLLEKYSGVEAFVLVKNTMETLVQALELMKEKAIKSVDGKEQIVMGAKVTLKSSAKKYEYNGTRYDKLKKRVDEAKKELKTHTDILEMSKDGWINPLTGETETAMLISGEGTTINVTFQGNYK